MTKIDQGEEAKPIISHAPMAKISDTP